VTALDTGSAGVWTGTDGVEDNLRMMIENVLGKFKALSEWSKLRTDGLSESGSLFGKFSEYGLNTVRSSSAAPAVAYRWPALNSGGAGTDEDTAVSIQLLP
jgi:hypothetical protein